MSSGERQLRGLFHQELAEVDAHLSELIRFVTDEVADASEALLRRDARGAIEVESRRHLADPLYDQVADQVGRLMARQAPVASDLRYLLAVLRAVPELEQSADLAAQIAWRGGLGTAASLTPRARALVTRTGDLVTAMWQQLSRAWDQRAATAAESLEAASQELGDLHIQLIADVAGAGMPPSVTMDMALIGRFYERLGDHAVNIAGQLDGLSTWSGPGEPAGP